MRRRFYFKFSAAIFITTALVFCYLKATEAAYLTNIGPSGGNVGIGTTNPTGTLEVSGSSSPSLIVKGTTGTGSPTIGFTTSNGFGVEGFKFYYNGATGDTQFDNYYGSGKMLFRTNVVGTPVTAMAIIPSGNVGIVKTAPGAALDVVGAINSNSTINGTGLCIAGDCKTSWTAVGAASSGWTQNGTEVYKTNTSGNVGIGTTTPSATLHVQNSGGGGVFRVTNSSGSFGFGVDTLGGYAQAIGGGGGMWFWNSAGSGGMGVAGSGNVGIGTTNPVQKLHVVGNFRADSNAGLSNLLANFTNAVDSDLNIKVTATSDTDKGALIAPSTNTYLALGKSGAEVMRIANTGNIGIGTTNPGALLEVAKSTSPVLRLRSTSTTGNQPSLQFYSDYNSSSERNWELTNAHDVMGMLQFRVSTAAGGAPATSVLAMTSGGNVGIGKTNPGATLDVTGAINSGSTVNSTGLCIASDCKTAWSQVGGVSGWTTDSSTKTTTTYNVGIGTTAPGAKLHISSGDTSLALFGPNSSWGGKLYVGASPNQGVAQTAQVISTDGNLHLDPAPSKNIYIGYYQARDIYINPNGANVGIGNAGPGAKLDVTGAINSNSTINGTGLCIAGDCRASWAAAGSYWVGNGNHIYNSNSGNVGIGTTAPASPLHIKGSGDQYSVRIETTNSIGPSIRFQGSGSYDGKTWSLFGSGSGNPLGVNKFALYDETSSQYRLVVDTSGNVGIGTTAPGALLSVNGAGVLGTTFQGDITDGSKHLKLGANSTAAEVQSTGGVPLYINYGGNNVQMFTNVSANLLVNGNVGIGTTNPVTPLEVIGSTSNSSIKAGSVEIQGYGVNNDWIADNLYYNGGWKYRANGYAAQIYFDMTNTGINFITAPSGVAGAAPSRSSRMVISPAGNVGISKTNPGAALDVVGAINSNSTVNGTGLCIASDCKTAWSQVGGVSGWTTDSSTKTTTTYNVGISTTTPAVRLHVYGNGTTAAAFTNGSVGVGFTNPGVLLDVNGYLRATGATISSIGAGMIMADSSGNLYSTSTAIATGIPSPSGISGYTLRSNGTNWVANNLLFNDGTNVGIGVTAPSATLQVMKSGGALGFTKIEVDDPTNVYQSVLGADSGGGSTQGFVGTQSNHDFVIRTNNTEKVRITSGGFVGIGTTNPTYPLQINSTVGGGGMLSLLNTSGVESSISYRISNGSASTGWVAGNANNDFFLWSYSLNAQAMTLKPSGNVGIGTTAPTRNLEVASAIAADTIESRSSGDPLEINYYTGAPTKICATASCATISAYFSTGGKVGIGTTAPAQGKLWVQDGDIWVTGNQRLAFSTDGSTDETPNVAIRANGNNTFFSNWSGSAYLDRMTILGADGNVGIGTTAPGARLDVYGGGTGHVMIGEWGGGNTYAGLGLAGSLATGNYNLLSGPADTNLYINRPTGKDIRFRENNADQVTILTGGNVGIGTTAPGQKLEIAGAVKSTSNSANFAETGGQFDYYDSGRVTRFNSYKADSTGAGMEFRTGGTSSYDIRMSILSSGNVGIGTTTPSTKLEVGGDVTAVAYYYSSDRNLKTNIKTLNNALEKVTKLRGVSFDWKNSGEPSLGLIAQEVQKVYPELVGGQPGNLTIQYGNLVAPLIEAVKEQQKQIDNQEKEINRLEVKVRVLESKKK